MSALWAVALIMLCSGAAKLRSREDVGETFRRLKVPRPFAAPALARAFPWLELLLAAALVQPVAALRPVVGVVAVALFVAFLVLVVRAKDDGVSCGCFGEASAAPISATTIARNVLFLALASLALVEGIVSAAAHGWGVQWLPLTDLGPAAWAWGALVALLLAAAALLVGRESVPAAEPAAHAADVSAVPAPAPTAAGDVAPSADGEPDRHPIQDGVLIQDGVYRGLHLDLSSGPILALRLSTGCGSCNDVIDRLPEFMDDLGPVRLRVLMPWHSADPQHAPAPGRIPPELVLGDPDGAVARSLGLTSFPTAALLGADRLTAAGPVGGSQAVLDLLEEVRAIVQTEILPAAQAVEAPADAAPLADGPVSVSPADPAGRA